MLALLKKLFTPIDKPKDPSNSKTLEINLILESFIGLVDHNGLRPLIKEDYFKICRIDMYYKTAEELILGNKAPTNNYRSTITCGDFFYGFGDLKYFFERLQNRLEKSNMNQRQLEDIKELVDTFNFLLRG